MRLWRWRYTLNGLGLVHTFLCGGVVFGWASLEAVLRAEGRFRSDDEASLYALVFTLGAVGNYTSNLPFGALLDATGPKVAGCVASALFGFFACLLWLGSGGSRWCLGAGMFGLGFVGPGIQLPTLHLSCLFEDGAVVMSMQAASFDLGALAFAVARALPVSSGTFLRMYAVVVPTFTFVTSLLLWPMKTLERGTQVVTASPGSPSFLLQRTKQQSPKTLRSMVGSRPFIFLAAFAAIHILKLNFVVTSVNEQASPDLVAIFGWMLPLGFVSAPVTAWLLARDPHYAFTLANVFGIIYGSALVLGDERALLYVAFPLVALSRQLVYSSVFHFIGARFGFAKYGTLLGIVNVVVALVGCLQYAFVSWAQKTSYANPNLVLLALTIPLFLAPPKPTPERRRLLV